jgi:hypothetical protein
MDLSHISDKTYSNTSSEHKAMKMSLKRTGELNINVYDGKGS